MTLEQKVLIACSKSIFYIRNKRDQEKFIYLVIKYIKKIDIGSMSKSEEYVLTKLEKYIESNTVTKIKAMQRDVLRTNSWYRLSQYIDE